MRNKKEEGFTLLELIVVVAIIGLIATLSLASINTAREKARVAAALSDIKQVDKVVHIYFTDTGTYPVTCNRTCTQAGDPFLNSLGVAGWSGPYATLWSQKTPWGGHLNYYYDVHGPVISFDDDAPGAAGDDNTGIIPDASIFDIDRRLDDGDPTTGRIQYFSDPECNAAGEFCYFVNTQ